MMTQHDDRSDGGSSTLLAAAALGGGAVLLWRLLRGAGTRWRRDANGSGSGIRSEEPSTPRAVTVRVRAGDRIEVDDVATDLATAITLARIAGQARFLAAGDARQGWVSAVFHALVDAGVMVAAAPDLTKHLKRYDDSGRPMPGNSAGSTDAARDDALTAVTRSSSRRDESSFLAAVRNASPELSSQSCSPHPLGGGALVRSSYRVPPFLADDILLVKDPEANTQDRVHCVAYDLVWHERHPERSGWLDRENLTPIFEAGMRVELSPLCPLWGRGAKRGTIRQVTKDWTVIVKMDDPRVRRLQRFTDHTQLTMRESPQSND
jgi:hypothetical protein